MAISEVLLAVDDEVFGMAIVDFVAKHRWPDQTRFTVLHAVNPAESAATWPSAQAEQEAKRLVKHIADKLRQAFADVKVEEVVSFGRPKQTIIDLAKELKAGLILMGSHGRHGLSGFLIGSVSQSVASHAPCSVAIVRPARARTPHHDLTIDWRGTGRVQESLQGSLAGPMKVLLAVEDEKFAERIVDFIKNHGFPDGTTFRVLHVHPWMPSERELLACPALMDFVERQYEIARELVSATASKIKEALPRTTVEEEVTEGQPAVRIIATATAWGANAIIMGSHGRNDMQQFLLGSVCTAVLSHADCSTIILRPSGKDIPVPNNKVLTNASATALPEVEGVDH